MELLTLLYLLRSPSPLLPRSPAPSHALLVISHHPIGVPCRNLYRKNKALIDRGHLLRLSLKFVKIFRCDRLLRPVWAVLLGSIL